MNEKEKIFRALDEICKPECILASNVSSLPITEIASYTKRPDKVVGMHFFLPVPVMKLVEVGGGLDTSDETINTVVEEARKLGKIPVALKDTPGFISNHVLQVMINEAIDALENDVASVEDIDTVMRLGMNHPMGPLELADLIGLDMVYNILNVLYEAYGQSKYKPCPLLRQYVQAGWLGKKCGRGFYRYENGKKVAGQAPKTIDKKGGTEMSISTVMVLGAGQMGGGIAQVMASAGHKTYLFNVRIETANKKIAFIDGLLTKSVAKGKITQEQKDATMANLIPTDDINYAGECDLVVEALPENLELKEKFFRSLDEICKPDCILATNTSSLPITQLASFTKRPEKVIGMHFFNPAPVMRLVEIISGIATSEETKEIIKEEARQLNKVPVSVRDVAGFAGNRILHVMLNEAFYVLQSGVASVEDIDTVMKNGMNHPMGPLELADFIGLDTVLSILNVMYEDYGQPKYKPCPLLRQYVYAGWLGKKSGRGFYKYEDGKKIAP